MRAILDESVDVPTSNFLVALHDSMHQVGGADLDLPARPSLPREVAFE